MTRATSLPSSTLARSGRPAARIEYDFDGTLDRDNPLFRGTRWMSPAARTSGSRSIGCIGANTTFLSPSAALLRPSRAAPAVDHEHEVVLVRESSGRVQDEIERLREADVARVHHHGLAGQSVLGPVAVVALERTDLVGVDEVWITRIFAASSTFFERLSFRSSDRTVTASARR